MMMISTHWPPHVTNLPPLHHKHNVRLGTPNHKTGSLIPPTHQLSQCTQASSSNNMTPIWINPVRLDRARTLKNIREHHESPHLHHPHLIRH